MRKPKPLAETLYEAKEKYVASLGERIRARRASDPIKAIAAASPRPASPSTARSLRDTYPQLRCAMNWRLKSRLEFLRKLHGVEIGDLVAALIEDSIVGLEAASRAREDLQEKWLEFDALFAEADRQEAQIIRERAWGSFDDLTSPRRVEAEDT